MIDISCKKVIKHLNINKFIETGTYKGETVAEVCKWFSEFYLEFGKIEKLIHTDARGNRPWNVFIAYIEKLIHTGARSAHPWNTSIAYIDTLLHTAAKCLHVRPWYQSIAYPIFKECMDSNYKIYSVDIDPKYYKATKDLFSTNPNVIIKCKNSEQFLKELIDDKTIKDTDNCFFYLDAHWKKYWPLRDEIKQVLRLNRFVILIDDFRVPGHPEFGYDIYDKQACGWDYIKDLFKNRKVVIYYPKKLNRDNRGWVLIFHGYPEERLGFLNDLS